MKRTEAVLLLGRSLLDYLPQARQSSSVLGGDAGLAPGRTVPCTACAAKGRVSRSGHPCASCQSLLGPKAPARNNGGHGCRPCIVCGGSGWRRRRKGDDPWDDHARVELASGDVGEGTSGDDLERRLAHTTRLLDEWERPESVAYGWENRKVQMWQAGDYAELEKALRILERMFPESYRLWWRIVVLDEPVRLSSTAVAAIDEATDVLARWMPKRPIRVPKYLRPDEHATLRKTSLWRGRTSGHGMQRAQRDAAIVEQKREGWSNSRIGEFHALTDRRVKQIIREQTQPVASAAA